MSGNTAHSQVSQNELAKYEGIRPYSTFNLLGPECKSSRGNRELIYYLHHKQVVALLCPWSPATPQLQSSS